MEEIKLYMKEILQKMKQIEQKLEVQDVKLNRLSEYFQCNETFEFVKVAKEDEAAGSNTETYSKLIAKYGKSMHVGHLFEDEFLLRANWTGHQNKFCLKNSGYITECLKVATQLDEKALQKQVSTYIDKLHKRRTQARYMEKKGKMKKRTEHDNSEMEANNDVVEEEVEEEVEKEVVEEEVVEEEMDFIEAPDAPLPETIFAQTSAKLRPNAVSPTTAPNQPKKKTLGLKSHPVKFKVGDRIPIASFKSFTPIRHVGLVGGRVINTISAPNKFSDVQN